MNIFKGVSIYKNEIISDSYIYYKYYMHYNMHCPEGVHNVYINMQYDSPTPLPILSTTTEYQCQLLQLVTKSIP